ncbi:uncharacterized protein [Spinacia oleracea]|uniref:Uncharacterized protein n=1 Tax=Spinacia oleracea TaxID=3562 RepID=A0A9R0IA32_SPIOL|nr:uncharacterized protein LOC110784181 [Spinacia oleracea]
MSCVSCDSECRTSAAAFEPIEVSGEFRKISYTRDYLLSLVEVNVPKSLPTGFDRSILSELDDACKSECEHQKLPGNESPFTGRTLVDSSRSSSEKWGGCKLSSEDSKSTGCKVDRFLYKSAPENQKFPLLESPFTGKIYSDSSRDSSEKWGSCKLSSEDSKSTGCKINRFICKSALEHQKLPLLQSPVTGKICSDSTQDSSEKWGSCKWSSKDSKSTDEGKFLSNQSNRFWQKPESTAILGSVQNSEQSGVLGSWSASKLLSPGPEVAILKPPGTDSCLLSRWKEPYRPPPFYKAMNHSGLPNHDTSSNETPVCAECSSKERAMEGSWRKDTCLVLDEHPTVPEITSQKNPSPVSPAICGSVVHPCYGEASEECRTEESPDHHLLTQDPVVQQLPSKSQLIKMDSGLEIDVEELQGQILEGGRFSALINLKEAEEIDAYFLDEKHDVLVDDGRNSYRTKSKFIHWFPENDEANCNVSPGAEKDGWKVWGAPTRKSTKENHSGQRKPEEASTYSQKAPCSKKIEADVLDCLGSDHIEPNNSYPDDISYDSGSIQESYELDKVTDNADLSLELNLPDEDSLIAIDDIYIFKQEEPNPPKITTRGGRVSPSPDPSPDPWFHESRKTRSENVQQNLSFPDPWFHESQKTGSENVQQNLSFPDPWFHESQKTGSENVQQNLSFPDPWFHESQKSGSENVQQNFNLPDPWFHESHVNAPPTFHYPLNRYNHYNPYAFIPPTFGHQTQNYEPIQNFPQPRMSHADDDYCPELDKILSTDPSNYHQFLQTPCCDSEPNVLRSIPLNYQTNVKSTMDMGKRGFLANERVKSAINHYLHIQRMLAQRNLEAAEQRAYSQALSNRFW